MWAILITIRSKDRLTSREKRVSEDYERLTVRSFKLRVLTVITRKITPINRSQVSFLHSKFYFLTKTLPCLT